MKKIKIFGHKNPDTDSVVGAISLSYLKNKLGMDTEPRVLGEINDETKFALKYFNIKKPEYLNDVKVRIKDIDYHKDFFINQNKSIYDTYSFMSENNITGIPLVDDKNKFVGYVSLKEIARSTISDNTNYLNTTFMNIVNTLKSNDYIKVQDEIDGYIVAATFDDTTFINDVKLTKENILIVGDRKRIIDYAIDSKVKLIIIIGNHKFNDEQLIKVKNNNINVICTPYSSFETSKLLGLSNSIKTIIRNENCISLDTEDYLSDFIEISNKTKHTNYPIVDNKGNCQGLLRLIDTNDYEKHKVILVDHNESKQSVVGLDEAEILEVVDHHNISDINTSNPINFRNMAVGCVNTIIYLLYKENNIEIPNDIAGIMLSAILSDTTLLNSPTTTDLDRFVVKKLSKQIGLDYNDYGMKLLKSGMNFEGYSLDDIIYRDNKTYTINNYKFSIGQVFCVDFDDFKDKIEDYANRLEEINKNNDFMITVLFVTNILTKSSYVLYNKSSENIIKNAYDLDNIYEGYILKGVLSRKKQIVPNIMNVIEKI